MVCTVEIICVGNELLTGDILNTNAKWLAKHITQLGGRVRRINTIGDVLDDFFSALKGVLLRKPTFIIVTGGLGPTFDDKTSQAIANTLNKPITLNDEAFDMVKKKYRKYEAETLKHIDLTPARLKMARIPYGAKPLSNPVGTAPGIYIKYDASKIVALPGVPSEMKAMFANSIVPMIKKAAGAVLVYKKKLKVTGILESEMAPLIEKIMHNNPLVYIKSRPKAEEPISILELQITKIPEPKKKAKNDLDLVTKQLSQKILERGGKVEK
ncbi:MAG: hypothetical protein JSV20_09340, partial [Candidatus Bathyarchaeota archaeon]